MVDEVSTLDRFLVETARIGRLPLLGVNDVNIPTSLKLSGTYYLDGYFQYFWTTHQLREVFEKLRSSIRRYQFKDINFSNQSCIIHIRGGDFIGLDQFNIVKDDWYISSVNELISKNNINEFFVVSDSKDLASNLALKLTQLLGIKVSLSSNSGYLEDFHMIRISKYRIVGNSTFGLTAAALAEPDSLTIAFNKFDRFNDRAWKIPSEDTYEL
jgi:hypothetical protein